MNPATFFKKTISSLDRSLKRFPITLLFSTAVAVILITISELQPITDTILRNNLNRLAMISALGIPLSLCLSLLFEKSVNKKTYKLVMFHILMCIFLIFYYFLFLDNLNMVSETRYIAVNIALYLCFLYIPYFPKKEKYEMYIINIFTVFFITLIYSIVLFLGLSAIFFTIDKLLSVRITSKFYYYTWLLVALIFAPSYFLSGIPYNDQQNSFENYPKILKILLLYIIIPLLTVYTAILYIYFIKIIITSQWPIGLVSNLVLWYSVITIAVLFLITPIKYNNKWANLFSNWITKFILPVLIMMFISIGIRINAYGVTEKRYFVVILGIWVTCIFIYLCLSKNQRNIIIPVTLSIVCLISVFGPLSSYSLSKFSQNRRFEKILIKNNMLKDKKIQPASSNISLEDKAEISSILNYFKNNHSLKELRYLPENFKIEDMDNLFGFSYVTPNIQSPQYYMYFSASQEVPINISGYDYLFDTRYIYGKNNMESNNINIVYKPDSSIIKIDYNGNLIYQKDLSDFIREIVKKYNGSLNQNTIPLEDMIFSEENENIKVKFIFMNVSVSKDASLETINLNGADFYILIKMK